MWYYPYIILSIILLLFLIYIYIRLKYGFWFYQPVFHIYDFRYYLFPPGIINHSLPKKNKYTNFKQIDTLGFEKVSELKMTQFINFIQLHYLQNKQNRFIPLKENIVPYFSYLNAPVFFSFYYEDTLLQDSKSVVPIADKKIISVMTSRPINIAINNGNSDARFTAYYVDYLCVDKAYRKKGIAPEMIQTHHYNQSHLNKDISVSLFKREGELTGIVPLCVFSTYGFSMKSWSKPPAMPVSYHIVECVAKNSHLFFDFLREKMGSFDIVLMVEYGNLLELLKTGNIFIYFILSEDDDEIHGAYFFRKTCIYVEKGAEALTCFASINAADSVELFIQGYKNAMYKIMERHKQFKFAVIENISHNNILVDDILQVAKPFVISPTAYFFYNFAYPTFKPSKTLVLC
jgi:hypothetical protein